MEKPRVTKFAIEWEEPEKFIVNNENDATQANMMQQQIVQEGMLPAG